LKKLESFLKIRSDKFLFTDRIFNLFPYFPLSADVCSIFTIFTDIVFVNLIFNYFNIYLLNISLLSTL